MKYVVVLCDGMADYAIESLGGKTPMEAANKPYMNALCKKGVSGLVKTVADGLKPGSDVANLSVLGYDPKKYYSGRSPLEAASIGIDMAETDVSLRCNLVTLSDDEPYENKVMVDYCAGDIHTKEAAEIIKTVNEVLSDEEISFYSGVSYRHCCIVKNGTCDLGEMTPPHDISGKKITQYLSKSENAEKLIGLMKKSAEFLKDHEINKKRVAEGKNPANSIWLWGEGRKLPLPSFESKYGLKGAIISAVDLLKGIGVLTKMQVIDVPGATGYIDTDFDAKARAAVDALKNGNDFVYIHLEAPDECSHRGELQNKIKAIELIDQKVLKYVYESLKESGEDFRILIVPDHATPMCKMTHTSDYVPFLIYDSTKEQSGADNFCEKDAKKSGVVLENGPEMLGDFLKA